jgi:hypothetical protein
MARRTLAQNDLGRTTAIPLKVDRVLGHSAGWIQLDRIVCGPDQRATRTTLANARKLL